MTRFAKILIIAFIFLLGFAFGGMFQDIVLARPVMEEQEEQIDLLSDKYNAFFEYGETPMYCTPDEAVSWLARAAKSHEHHLTDDDPADDEFHQGCIDRYHSIMLLIRRLEGQIDWQE
jgi:hypothetical protein